MMDATLLFEVGSQITLERELDKQSIKYRTRVIGWLDQSWLILELPMLNGAYVNWPSGTSVIGKFQHSGDILNFRTMLIKVIHHPIPLMFLDFPLRIESATTREFQRIQTYLMCSIYAFGDPKQPQKAAAVESEVAGNAVVLDFSRGGGQIEIWGDFEPVAIGQQVGLDLMLPNGESVDGLVVEIRNLRIESNRRVVGVQFMGVNPQPLNIIERFFDKYSSL